MMNTALVIDDNEMIRLGLEKFLRGQGFLVLTAQDGKEALSALEVMAYSYNIIFLDINLPDTNGLEILKLIREKNPEAVVVVMSAAATRENEQSSRDLGARHFVEKPFGIPEIKDVIHTALIRTKSGYTSTDAQSQYSPDAVLG